MAHTISVYDPSTSSSPLHELWEKTIAASHPPYSLPADKFHSLVSTPLTTVFVVKQDQEVVGYAITYLIRSGSQWSPSQAYHKGALASLIVDPAYRKQGLGTALHTEAIEYLTVKIKESFSFASPQPEKSQIQLGSTFPRIFPGVPDGPEFEDARQWFQRRGWEYGPKLSIDLYRTLGPEDKEGLDQVMRKAKNGGFTFGHPKKEDVESLYQLQKDNFDAYTGWPDMFPRLIDAERQEDIYVIWDKVGEIVGATVVALVPEGGKEGPMHESLAWPATLGSRCGVIACVGVAASTRGSGAGVAMVAAATQNLIDRGADGCFIDWVDMDGFYEKCGFHKWEKAYHGAWMDVKNN